MSQSGGFAGITRVTERDVVPGSPGHRAAVDLLADDAEAAGRPGRPDAFAYDVAIAGPGGELLRATFRDPLPATVTALLDALS